MEIYDIRDMMQEDVLDNVIETVSDINSCLLQVYPHVAETELGAVCIKTWYDSIDAINALLLWLSNDVYKTAILKQSDLKPSNDEEMDESTGVAELEEQLNMFISCIIELRQKLVSSLSEIIMLRDKYDDEMLVPDSDFNEHKARAKESWQFTGTAIKTFEITQNIMSNEKVIFRAVKA
jgi:hypothetical protein